MYSMRLRDCYDVIIVTITLQCLLVDVVSAKDDIILAPLKTFGDGAVLQWCGLQRERVTNCQVWYSYKPNSSYTAVNYQVLSKNYTFELDMLKPLAEYDAYGVCYDKNQEHEVDGMHKSEVINFTTAAVGQTEEYPETPRMTACKAITYPQMKSSPPTVSMRPAVPDSSMAPTVLRERMSSKGSKVDIGLGVAFGLLGAGIVCAGAYWVLKEYRRRMRIRRFLQYRQHENETFPDIDIDNDEDEGIVL